MDTNAETIRAYLLAGEAIFTVTSRKSGARFTYRVALTEDQGAAFVSVLTGPDNVADYEYAGMLVGLTGALGFRTTRGSRIKATAPSVMGFQWLLGKLNHGHDIGESAEFDPMGKCSRCRRALTDPESVRTGLGPICREKVL